MRKRLAGILHYMALGAGVLTVLLWVGMWTRPVVFQPHLAVGWPETEPVLFLMTQSMAQDLWRVHNGSEEGLTAFLGYVISIVPNRLGGVTVAADWTVLWFRADAAAALSGLILLTCGFLSRWLRYAKPGHCRTCGYDLRGASTNRCSECGTPFEIGERPPPQSVNK